MISSIKIPQTILEMEQKKYKNKYNGYSKSHCVMFIEITEKELNDLGWDLEFSINFKSFSNFKSFGDIEYSYRYDNSKTFLFNINGSYYDYDLIRRYRRGRVKIYAMEAMEKDYPIMISYKKGLWITIAPLILEKEVKDQLDRS